MKKSFNELMGIVIRIIADKVPINVNAYEDLSVAIIELRELREENESLKTKLKVALKMLGAPTI